MILGVGKLQNYGGICVGQKDCQGRLLKVAGDSVISYHYARIFCCQHDNDASWERWFAPSTRRDKVEIPKSEYAILHLIFHLDGSKK